MSLQKINSALSDCLAKCCASPYPLSTLAQFRATLGADPSWSEYEVEAVELKALRVLSRLVTEPAETT
jgi:hypothetical protein